MSITRAFPKLKNTAAPYMGSGINGADHRKSFCNVMESILIPRKATSPENYGLFRNYL